MSQCVPSWDIDDGSAPLPPPLRHPAFNRSISSNSSALDVPSLDYEVAELTWENGQLAMHGLAPPRVAHKHTTAAAWGKPRAAGGTLESIVDQATGQRHPKPSVDVGGGNVVNELVPWFDHRRAVTKPAAASASITMTMDALVPSGGGDKNVNRGRSSVIDRDNSAHVLESVPRTGTCVVGPSVGVGSCSGAAGGCGRLARAAVCGCGANPSVSESATCGGGRDSRQVTIDTCERELGLTSTSMWSPENTSSGKEYSRTSGEDHDSVCHSRPQIKEGGDGRKRKGYGESSVSTKKSRAAAIHNQSERKRRDKINQRMKTLQKLVPNSNKTDKASMLDEVIEYLKQLQAQVHVMSRMNMPSMMMPLAMQQQHIQMSMMGMGMGMGMGGLMDLNSIGRAAAMPPQAATTAAFMPTASSWDVQHDRFHSQPTVMPDLLSAFLACQSQSQPMTMDAYSRMAAFYQQFQQPPTSGSKN